MRKPEVGDIAEDERGNLGLVTRVVTMLEVTMYEGVHLTGKAFPVGSPWLSRSAEVIGQAKDVVEEAWMYRDLCK